MNSRRAMKGVAIVLLAASTGPVAASTLAPDAGAAVVIDYILVDGFEPGPDCSVALTCTAPAGANSCVSGRVFGAGSGTALRAAYNVDQTCAGGAIGGACDLTIRAYDATDYYNNPNAATPLASVEQVVDGCGRFRFSNLTHPASGFVIIASDDADPAPENDLHVPSASPRAVGAGQALDGVTALATRRDTVANWTQSAGAPFGASTFADMGVILFQYRVAGAPRPGVTVTSAGSTVAANDYYFADLAPLERIQVDAALTATGANGAALFVNGGALTNYSGTGAEPIGCTWPQVIVGSIPGVVFYVEIGC